MWFTGINYYKLAVEKAFKTGPLVRENILELYFSL
jgi:hypothetical protein